MAQIQEAAFANKGDHAELLGFNLLNFDVFKDKLDPIRETGMFKGFFPRWTLPTKLRNVHDPSKNASCILVILDSSREVDLGIAEFFTDEVMWKSEIMVQESLLKYLNVSATKKDEVELYFDLIGLAQALSITSQNNFRRPNMTEVDAEFNNVLQQLLPSPEQIAKILKEDLNL